VPEDDVGCTLDNLSVGHEIGVVEFLSGAPKLRFDVGIRAENSLDDSEIQNRIRRMSDRMDPRGRVGGARSVEKSVNISLPTGRGGMLQKLGVHGR